ncbi:MAG: MauE/DoxX family redox-associated membrane protein [Pseudohongiellaceae bacterium]
MLDPLLFRLIAVAFCLLLLAAGLHKLGDRPRFQGILTAYQVLPANLTPLLSRIIPFGEIALGLGWMIGWRIDLVAAATAVLLAAYALAMAINLLRGRSYIDCGCGFSSAKAGGDDNGVQQLSVRLVYRNILLIALAVAAATGATARSFAVLDYFSLFAALAALVFIYSAFHQLLVNRNAIDSWRKPLLAESVAENDHD